MTTKVVHVIIMVHAKSTGREKLEEHAKLMEHVKSVVHVVKVRARLKVREILKVHVKCMMKNEQLMWVHVGPMQDHVWFWLCQKLGQQERL